MTHGGRCAPSAAANRLEGASRSSWRHRLTARAPVSGPALGAGVVCVSPDNVADEAVAYDVRLVEVVEGNAINPW